MPRTPKGHKRPADVIGNAVRVMKVATGEAEEPEGVEDDKNEAAAALGRLGGAARARTLSAARRRAIAKKAASTRWKKKGTRKR